MSDSAVDATDDWNFELGDSVTLLWAVDTTGLVIGRTELLHEDDKYLVEYPLSSGKLVRNWVYASSIDHQSVH